MMDAGYSGCVDAQHLSHTTVKCINYCTLNISCLSFFFLLLDLAVKEVLINFSEVKATTPQCGNTQ